MTTQCPTWGRALTIEQAIFFAQACRCFYCPAPFQGPHTKRNRHKCWTRDHLNPAENGNGRTRNLVLACGDCNAAKANRLPTKAEIERAATIHAAALNLMQMFNGAIPPEWAGFKQPQLTQRALDKQARREMNGEPTYTKPGQPA